MRWRTSKSTPHCLAISHTCRASTSARPCGARTARGAARGAGRVPEEAALQVPLALHVLALGAHPDGALQRLSSSVRAAPGKGFWKMIMLSMTPCSTSSVHSSRSVLLAKHTPTLLEVGGLPHTPARQMEVLYGHEFSPLGIGLNVQPECKLHCEVRLFISRRKNLVR